MQISRHAYGTGHCLCVAVQQRKADGKTCSLGAMLWMMESVPSTCIPRKYVPKEDALQTCHLLSICYVLSTTGGRGSLCRYTLPPVILQAIQHLPLMSILGVLGPAGYRWDEDYSLVFQRLLRTEECRFWHKYETCIWITFVETFLFVDKAMHICGRQIAANLHIF